jgi:hypothetical protein
MSQVLYFPNLSLPEAGWVNPAILFFDCIGVISPDHPDERDDLFDERTQALIDAQVVKPVWPGHFYSWGSSTEETLFNILTEKTQTKPIADQFERLHVGKFRHSNVLERLIDRGFVKTTESDSWVSAPDWMAIDLMNYLALQLSCSPDLGMDLVTDRGIAWTCLTGRAVGDYQADQRLRAITSLLPVGPDADVDGLLNFRARQSTELIKFRSYIEALLHDASSPETRMTGQFEARLTEAERCRKELVQALETMRWGKVFGRVFVSALPMASSFADHSPWSAGAGLVSLGLQLREEWNTRQTGLRARRDPLAYAALASSDLKPPKPRFGIFGRRS